MDFPSQMFFNDINHGYRAAILKKNSLWLLPSYMTVAAYCYYEKVHRTMRTATASYLLKLKHILPSILVENLLLPLVLVRQSYHRTCAPIYLWLTLIYAHRNMLAFHIRNISAHVNNDPEFEKNIMHKNCPAKIY